MQLKYWWWKRWGCSYQREKVKQIFSHYLVMWSDQLVILSHSINQHGRNAKDCSVARFQTSVCPSRYKETKKTSLKSTLIQNHLLIAFKWNNFKDNALDAPLGQRKIHNVGLYILYSHSWGVSRTVSWHDLLLSKQVWCRSSTSSPAWLQRGLLGNQNQGTNSIGLTHNLTNILCEVVPSSYLSRKNVCQSRLAHE